MQWIEVNLPWHYENEEGAVAYSEARIKYNIWLIMERNKKLPKEEWRKDSVAFNEFFYEWLPKQPETIEIDALKQALKNKVDDSQFASHPMNKTGVLIEVRRYNGDCERMLIGDVLSDGGTGGEYGLES